MEKNQEQQKQQQQPHETKEATVAETKGTTTTDNNNADNGDNAEDCVVCFKPVTIYSIGECDHPVCYECSTRMRVLCQQNECPICRQVLLKVIFTYDKLPYRELEAKNRSEFYSKRYKISFQNRQIQQAFFTLLDHPCPQCDVPPYRTFQGLKTHVRREHDLHFCEICVENLKIFTFERRCYTQAELNIHRQKGDVDNKSHRGHPLCEYCNTRYLDRDELFRHLRREHYFCHFCEADGCNYFYRDYNALADHFRKDHFLCEEGKCATEQFMGAFRTEIDYKAHMSSVHGKLMNKQQAKQNRTLQLEITLGPRGRNGQTEQNIAQMRTREEDTAEELINEEMHSYIMPDSISNEDEFPTLAGTSTSANLSLARPPPVALRNRGSAGLAKTKENFPALGGGGNNTNSRQSSQQTLPISSVIRQSPAASTGAIARTTTTTAKSSNNNTTGMVLHVFNRPGQSNASTAMKKTAAVDFPTLPSSSPIPMANVSTGAVARTTATSAKSSNNTTGMVLHVSNRPGQSNASTAMKKTSAVDFPTLSKSGKTKKNGRAVDEDMLPSSSPIPMANVSAKHRALMDDYVSVVNPSNAQKLQMVQRADAEAKAKIPKSPERMRTPNLDSQDFPSLGGGGVGGGNKSMLALSASWSKQAAASTAAAEKRQRELENRKAKVAPAPLLPKDNKNTSNNKKTLINSNNNSSNIANISEQKDTRTKENAKQLPKEKNNNNIEQKKMNLSNVNGEAAENTDSNRPPPPGFSDSLKPPPGFQSKVTLNSVAKSPNNLTFTSSLGESYSIVSTHTFIQPQDASERNQKLVGHFQSTLKSQEALEEFRFISQKFREGNYKPDAYYEHCQAALGDKFEQVFPELLALLPDISKQQALYLVHKQHINSLPPNQRKSLPKLEVCGICKQVLLIRDLESHRSQHELKKNFPSLGGDSSGAGKAATNNRK